MTNRGDLLAPPRTARPRHKVTPARLDRAAIPAGTGGVASGLAAASIGALVTIMIANGGHQAVQPHPAASVTRMSADLPSRHLPRPVYHPRTVAHRKKRRPAPAPPQPAGAQQAPTANPLSGIANGIGWQALEARSGLPPWAQRMVAAWSQALAARSHAQGTPGGTPPVQGPASGQGPVQGPPNGQAPAWP